MRNEVDVIEQGVRRAVRMLIGFLFLLLVQI